VAIPEISSRAFIGRVALGDSSGTALTLALTDYGTGLRVPWSMVTGVDRSIGPMRNIGAARGLLVGAGLGALLYGTQIGYAQRSVDPGWSKLGLVAGSVF